LHRVLTHRFSQAANVTIIQGDILASKHHLAPEVSDTLAHHDAAGNKPVKLVSNLPYRVATPVLMNLLLNHPSVRRFCFTVQAEVGDRLLAKPNTKAYGPLSIITQMLCTLSVITRLPPDAFWPKPAVDSVMIRMDVDDHPPINREHLGAFADLVRRTFEHRRKTIRSALGYVLSDLHRDRVCQHIDPKRRPEAFDVDEWLDIYRVAHA
jgi:16S rRNA (adenine1518-N6/adenine1519-N6)-dimethyltransferase